MNSSLSTPADILLAGLSGAGNDVAHTASKMHWLSPLAERIIVSTDVEVAFQMHSVLDLESCLLLGPDHSLGASSDGTEVRVGGWGQHIGDEGSGYQLVLRPFVYHWGPKMAEPDQQHS
ncbi:MAG: hypothetical protein Ct9H300mP15_25720 [Gemmatimonadota bacterium]|nr:MAG: hypothetical protein Ct9H300mP15_25720 [Gemmatimonadota bacterium]